MKTIHVLLVALILASCAPHADLAEKTNDNDKFSQNTPTVQDNAYQTEQEAEEYINGRYVRLGSGDFFAQEGILNFTTPDFLSEEQQLLYLRALSLYPVFNGSPMLIGDYPLKDGSYPTSEKMGTETIKIDGLTYLRVFGRYSKWSDFQEMMLSVYTEDYYPRISSNCIEHNGNTYILDSAAGMPFYSNCEKAPDEFELVSANDAEIVFYRYQYLFETGSENPIFGIKYAIVMKKVDDIWYVDLFEKDGEIEIEQ